MFSFEQEFFMSQHHQAEQITLDAAGQRFEQLEDSQLAAIYQAVTTDGDPRQLSGYAAVGDLFTETNNNGFPRPHALVREALFRVVTIHNAGKLPTDQIVPLAVTVEYGMDPSQLAGFADVQHLFTAGSRGFPIPLPGVRQAIIKVANQRLTS